MRFKSFMLVFFAFVVCFIGFKETVYADYKATVLITDGSKCSLSSKSTGKCFYQNTSFNSTVPGVVWLDTGDIVTVIDTNTYASPDLNTCDTYYVKATYSFPSNPNKIYTGYFCNSNLKKDGEVSNNYIEEFKNAGFPESYYGKLSILKEAHPNWTFRAINTNLDFKTAVESENSLGRSLIQVTSSVNNQGYLNTWSGSYNYYTDTFKAFDGSNWYAANYDTIAYYMDPRNFLIDMYIFQFEALAYEKDLQTLSVVEKLLNGDYLNNYSKSFITAASESNVSPVYLASLSKQEVGGHSYATTAVSGGAFTYNGTTYSGIYNPYNIGATSGTNPVYNGLYWATGSGYQIKSYQRPWDSMDKAIRGGAIWIGENYINVGQNTIYFKKWDVVANVNSNSGTNYTHQYQTNIQAPMSEANSVYKSYNDSNILNSSFVFYIPVYNNMPIKTSLPNTGNPNNYLKTLSINGNDVTNFDGGVTSYNYYVSGDTNNVTISATTVNDNASISGAGYVSLNSNNTTRYITVKAQNGETRTYTLNIIKQNSSETEENKGDLNITVQTVLNKAGIKNNSSYVSGFSVGMDISNIISKVQNVSNSEVVLKDKNGSIITSGIVKTGDTITIKTTSETKTLTLVLYGDANGDGKISAVDYVQIKNNIMGKTDIKGVYKEAADVNKDGKISAVDYVHIKNNIMGKSTISQ